MQSGQEGRQEKPGRVETTMRRLYLSYPHLIHHKPGDSLRQNFKLTKKGPKQNRKAPRTAHPMPTNNLPPHPPTGWVFLIKAMTNGWHHSDRMGSIALPKSMETSFARPACKRPSCFSRYPKCA